MIETGPRAIVIVLSIMHLMSGCATIGAGSESSFGNRLATVDLPASVDFYPDEEVLEVAHTRFADGQFGHAARYFERAVEVNPNDAEAWLGLAASYDRIRRFDLADRAYRRLGELVGHTAEYHNNVGYSYLLRGNLAQARLSLLRAQQLDPSNPAVANNLELLRSAAARTTAS